MQYISNTEKNKKEMLEVLGVPSAEALLSKVPGALRDFKWTVPSGISEVELVQEVVTDGRSNRNFHDLACYLGAGVYDHYVPSVVEAITGRGEFLTAYTPYQGEASQGTLQSIYEYQSLICELTAMDASNASMYDGATSLAEAALLALRSTGRKKILIPATVHPEYREVLKTYLACGGGEIDEIAQKGGTTDLKELEKRTDGDTAAIILQQPNFFGFLEDPARVSELAHQAGALSIACVNPVSLGILEPPGKTGADIAVGEGQPLGNAASFGGPHFGFFSVKEQWIRKMPGRIAGMTVDKQGRRAFVLTLQAREQHIRREKASSNICTNHSLCALKGAIHLVLLGPKGMRKWAILNAEKARKTYQALLKVRGVSAYSEKPFFNEFVLKIDRDAARLKDNFSRQNIIGPLDLSRYGAGLKSHYLFAVTEKRTDQDLERLMNAIEAS